ncbi:MAG: GNAT family N-acetyltransferase [Fimbriimonadaceae bacterium]|nr:GNAT family N-acetyltransferase [Fimbriimonadaceae bacterium]
MIRAVTANEDPAIPWIEALYEAAFEEVLRLPTGFLRASVARPHEGPRTRFLTSAEDEEGPLGFAYFELLREARMGYAIYLAVSPERRGRSVGSALLKDVVRRLAEEAEKQGCPCGGVMLEVERVEEAHDEADRIERERRLRFFAKHGARPLTSGYRQPPAQPGFPSVPLNLLWLPMSEARPEPLAERIRAYYRNGHGLGDDAPEVVATLGSLTTWL